LLQYLAVSFSPPDLVQFHSYIRTASPQKPPSEWVVSHALRHNGAGFSPGFIQSTILKKFLATKIVRNAAAILTAFGLDKAA